MASRSEGRSDHDLRGIKFETGIQKFADGSVLVSFGQTKVICAVTIEKGVPAFAKEEKTGWLTAEYAMLPGSTQTRASREKHGPKGRSQEIQRLIGRALRAVVDISAFPERSITIDCDVLQADGGTRTASVTGAFVALALAVEKAQKEGRLPAGKILTGQVAAVSCGVHQDKVLVDLNYEEDFACDVDCNLVMTADGKIVEIQGTAEGNAFTYDQWADMYKHGSRAISHLIQEQKRVLGWI